MSDQNPSQNLRAASALQRQDRRGGLSDSNAGRRLTRGNLSQSLCAFRSTVCLALLVGSTLVQAQGFMPDGQHFPLSQQTPPGVTAEWMARAGRVVPGYFQPVRFTFPSEGRVTVYAGPAVEPVELPEVSQIGLSVGQVYRLKLSHMPEYPGVELFPSVEVVDHLHPPAGRYGEFPILVEFTREELETAMDGSLVTRVVYLEQPQFARPIPQSTPMPVLTVSSSTNVIEAADQQGRPMLIVRMGSRMPPAVGGDRTFFGSGAPIMAAPVHETPVPAEIEQAIVRTPPEPRQSPAVRPRALSVPPPVQPALAEIYPDEYLFDGGDRLHPIHYSPLGTEGLDSEDAFAQFYDHHGRRHTQSTNRIAIFAPRFGAVRAVSFSATDVDVKHIADAKKARHLSGARNRLLASHYQQRSTGMALRMRSRASGVEANTRRLITMQTLRPAVHEKLINLYESFAFLQTGQIEQLDVAQTSAAVQAAHGWTRNQNPVIAAHLASLGEVYASFKAAEFVGAEFQGEDGYLRIVKLADRKAAAPGDVITFAIRFDNLGDRPLERVKIVDNLTPRLEYIEDSATSDREGDVSIEDNGEGSAVLTFVLDEPLLGKTGGVVEFQVRVR